MGLGLRERTELSVNKTRQE